MDVEVTCLITVGPRSLLGIVQRVRQKFLPQGACHNNSNNNNNEEKRGKEKKKGRKGCKSSNPSACQCMFILWSNFPVDSWAAAQQWHELYFDFEWVTSPHCFSLIVQVEIFSYLMWLSWKLVHSRQFADQIGSGSAIYWFFRPLGINRHPCTVLYSEAYKNKEEHHFRKGRKMRNIKPF